MKVKLFGEADLEPVKMNGERYIGVALDFSPSSRYALQWTVSNILRENDHLIVIVVNKEPMLESGRSALWQATGTRKPSTVPPPNYRIEAENSREVSDFFDLCVLLK